MVIMGTRVMVSGSASVRASDVIGNDFCMNYHDCYFNIHESMTVILTCYTCACPGGGV